MKENREQLKGRRVEYAVGTVLWWNGREIEVVRDTSHWGRCSCEGCALWHSRACHFAVLCHAMMRKDGTSVHFEYVRKEERI